MFLICSFKKITVCLCFLHVLVIYGHFPYKESLFSQVFLYITVYYLYYKVIMRFVHSLIEPNRN